MSNVNETTISTDFSMPEQSPKSSFGSAVPRLSFAERRRLKDLERQKKQKEQVGTPRMFNERKQAALEEVRLEEEEDLTYKQAVAVCKMSNKAIMRFRGNKIAVNVISEAWWKMAFEDIGEPLPKELLGCTTTQVMRKINQLVDSPQFWTSSLSERQMACNFFTRENKELNRLKKPPSTTILQVSEPEAATAQLSLACIKLTPTKSMTDDNATVLTVIERGNKKKAIPEIDEDYAAIAPGLVVDIGDDFANVLDVFPFLLARQQSTAAGCGELYFAYKARELDPPIGAEEWISPDVLLNTLTDLPYAKGDFPRVFKHSVWHNAMPVPSFQILASVIDFLCPLKDNPDRVSIHGNFPQQVASYLTDRHVYSNVSANYDPNTEMKLFVVSSKNMSDNVTGIYWNPTLSELPKLQTACGIVATINHPAQASDLIRNWMNPNDKYKIIVSYGSDPALWAVRDSLGKTREALTDSLLYRLALSGIWMAFHNLSNGALQREQYWALEYSEDNVVFYPTSTLLMYRYVPTTTRATWRNYVPNPIKDFQHRFKARIHESPQKKQASDLDQALDEMPLPSVFSTAMARRKQVSEKAVTLMDTS